jgi:hypothetical protein
MTIDVIQLASEANIDLELHMSIGREPVWIATQDELERFTALAMEECAKRRGTLMFNPYTGWARDPADIRSDPHGILLLDPEQPIHAAAIRARKPA